MAEAMLSNRSINKGEVSTLASTKTKDLSFILPSSTSTDSLLTNKQKNSSNNSIIGIIPSSKRQKLAKPTHELIHSAVEGINASISRSDRLSAIGAACATFDHDYSPTHDDEVRSYNVDSSLLKHLTLLLYKKNRLESMSTVPTSNGKDNNEWCDAQRQDTNTSDNNDEDDISSLKEEIGYTCSALEMVCRCKATTLSESFNKFGYELLEVLVFILKDFYRKNEDDHNNAKEYQRKDSVVSWDLVGTEGGSHTSLNRLVYHSYSGDFAVNKATKVLCHIARVGSAIEPLAKHHGILQVLKTIIDTVRQDDGHNYQEARLNTLWIIANLACAPENMVYMAAFPGLLKSLMKVVVHRGQCSAGFDDDDATIDESFEYNAHHHKPTTDYSLSSHSDSRHRTRCVAARGQAVRAFLNLSWAEENKLIFSNMTSLLRSLIELISPANNSDFMSNTNNSTSGNSARSSTAATATCLSVLKSTKRHAAGTLRNIAAVPSVAQKLHLCQIENGVLIHSLVTVLALPSSLFDATETNNTLSSSSLFNVYVDEQQQQLDDSVRERIFATFYNLCCDETVNVLKSYPDLLQAFREAANSTRHDINTSITNHASQQLQPVQDNNTTVTAIQELAERTLKFIQERGDIISLDNNHNADDERHDHNNNEYGTNNNTVAAATDLPHSSSDNTNVNTSIKKNF